MSPRIRLIGLASLALIYWLATGAALVFLAGFAIGALGSLGYCSGPGNQLGLPTCERLGVIVLVIGFFAALAVYSLILWKVARRGVWTYDPARTFE